MLWSSSTEIVSRANVPFRAPLGYEFSDKDREAYADRFYAMNPELITSGRYAQLWRESGKRGGGVATSMLPIIAIETWLGKKQDRRVIDGSSQLPISRRYGLHGRLRLTVESHESLGSTRRASA